MKGSSVIQQALKWPGLTPHLSENAVIIIALSQERIGEPREDHFFRLYQARLLQFFSARTERSRDQRRKRDLCSVILAVQVSLQLVLEALQREETAAIDSAPLPCVSYKRSWQTSDFLGTANYGGCHSEAMKSCGCKIQSVVGLAEMILGFLLAPASCSGHQPVGLDSFAHHLTCLPGDGASHDAVLQISRKLLAPGKETRAPIRSKLAHLQCLRCETVPARLPEPWHWSRYAAKSTRGMAKRIAAQASAQSVGTMVNTLLGRSALRFAELAV
jgi:hypothetical protein